MGDKHDSRTGALPEIEQEMTHLEPGDFVERGEGFVHQQDGSAECESANQRDALLHAARQFVGERIFESGESDACDQRAGVNRGGRVRRAIDLGE